MFQIINSFIAGDLTDEQCKHCLAATNLGMQYIFLTEKAVSQIKLTERCYISNNEREYYKNIRFEESKLGDDKVYTGDILAIGIGYWKDSKEHECKIEKLSI